MRLQEKAYPVRLVLKVARLSSAAWYTPSRAKTERQRPGPKPLIPDEELLAAIRQDLATSRFHSEGHKKVRARLQRRGIRAGRKRYLRLMKAHGLLAPIRPRWNGSSRRHDGSIRTDHPNQMWGTDAKQFWTHREGQCWFFGLVDHCNDEILGWHASVIGNRFAALEPVHQAVKSQFGSLDKGVVLDTGLFLRSDHGSQYDSDDFQAELKFLGLAYSPAFVHSPECNGIIERFNRTLQEQVFDIHCFETIEEARAVIATFIDDYNRFWLIERLGHRSPLEFKAEHQNVFLKCA
ncbi:MAG: transposase [Terriglobia bacterium]